MRLRSGQQAPAFDTTDIYGQPVRLRDFVGKKLLVCFYRYAGCPFCNLFLQDLIEHYAEFMRLGLKIVVFFQSPAYEVHKIPGMQRPPFPLVADPDRRIYDLYGVETSVAGAARTIPHLHTFIKAWEKGFPQRMITGEFFLMPAEFLIDTNQRISVSHYGRNIADVMSFEDTIRFITDMDKLGTFEE